MAQHGPCLGKAYFLKRVKILYFFSNVARGKSSRAPSPAAPWSNSAARNWPIRLLTTAADGIKLENGAIGCFSPRPAKREGCFHDGSVLPPARASKSRESGPPSYANRSGPPPACDPNKLSLSAPLSS